MIVLEKAVFFFLLTIACSFIMIPLLDRNISHHSQRLKIKPMMKEYTHLACIQALKRGRLNKEMSDTGGGGLMDAMFCHISC